MFTFPAHTSKQTKKNLTLRQNGVRILCRQQGSRLLNVDVRLVRAKELLSTGRLTVAQVAAQVGFCNIAYFSKVFKEAFKVQPEGYLCR